MAKQMEASYAVILACHGKANMTGEDIDLLEYQLSRLKEEAKSLTRGEDLWCDVVGSWEQDIAVDLGTAWNMLPAPVANPRLQNEAVRAKLNGPRKLGSDLWPQFMMYARSVITAHIISKNPEVKGEWKGDFHTEKDMPEAQEWVKACREGRLHYPPIGCTLYLTKYFLLRKHIEWWQYTAQDVTHVNASASDYQDFSSISRLGQDETNELLYSLTYGSVLSKKYTSEEVRAGLLRGELPGDRIILLASKRGNTKVGVPLKKVELTDTRETASGDDVMRECLTEYDRNLGTLAGLVHGVACRADNHTIEMKVDSLLATAGKNSLTISLDVSGWSPNMLRENEMEFCDMLLGFYDVPEAMKISRVFKDVSAVTSRDGFHDKWMTTDGSIQGFFGSADTILHSMMGQFALAQCKEKKLVGKSSKVQKITHR